MVTLQLWQLQKVLLRHHLHHGLSCQCLLFVRLGGQNEPYLSYFMFLASTQAVYNKSIICFNKLSVNMCEKNDFLKALMPCRGRKIIIHPAGSFTKYWNHISNFCFHLVLLWIYKHMFHFQVLFYFFCLCGNFQKCWTEKLSWCYSHYVSSWYS